MTINEKQERFLKALEPVNDRLSRFCRAMTRSTEEAKDLAADSIMQAYEKFESLKSDDSFRSWIFQIASRTLKRKNWRKRFFIEADEDYKENIPSPNPQPDKGLELEELYSALDKLPRKHREAIVLFEISGFTLMEIAEMQGSSLSAVKSRLKRGREKLAELMREDTNGYGKTSLKGNSSGGEFLGEYTFAQKVKR